MMKARYEKPSIKKVKLVPSEAVLQACKQPVAGGPLITGCTTIQTVCSAIGS